jgi:gluconokinase
MHNMSIAVCKTTYPMDAIVVMGVSGSGKSTVGEKLAARASLEFHDADQFHPPANIEKMSKGIPLDDEDRIPWLQGMSDFIHAKSAEGHVPVLACSALKKSYRDILRGGKNHITFIYLAGDFDLIEERMNARKDHFMPPGLLKSQFETLEEPDRQEAIRIDVSPDPDDIVESVVKELGL